MKLVLFYHAYIYGSNYVSIMSETFRLLVSSGLFKACDKLYIGAYEETNASPKDGISWLEHFWANTDKVEIIRHTVNDEERSTLLYLRDYCKENPDDYVLYFHTKGIVKYSEATQDWRRYMEYFNIERWKDCVKVLTEGYDCCGVLWNSDTAVGYFPHFSGTFWWATAKYINTLKIDYLNYPYRLYREFWIGSNPNVKVYEFHNSRMNDKEKLRAHQSHYELLYPKAYYENTERKLHIICTVYKKALELGLFINSFLLQTNPNWILHFVHDGPATNEIKTVISNCKDNRVMFQETKKVNGHYGHPNRNLLLNSIVVKDTDYILITNEDNYYVPVFVEYMLKETVGKPVGIVYCNMVHSYLKYSILNTKLIKNKIDCGSFIVLASVAKKAGFNEIVHNADGIYIEECKRISDNNGMQSIKIEKPLFIHN